MTAPFLLLLDADAERRDRLAAELGGDLFRSLAISPEAASSLESIAPDVVVLSLLPGSDLIELAASLRDDANRARLHVVALVPAGVPEAEEGAWATGAVDEVVTWPASEIVVTSRLRGLTRIARLRSEANAFERVLCALVRAFESRTLDTVDHSDRVADLAEAMAEEFGFSASSRCQVRRGALLHDIGLLAIPDDVLSLPGPLDSRTLDEIRAHVVLGYELLKGVPSLEPLLPFVLRHHERFDGSGYPDGLVGAEIALPVQLVALADAYDAMTSSRPYRPVFSRDAALVELEAESLRGAWNPRLIEPLRRATARRVVVAEVESP